MSSTHPVPEKRTRKARAQESAPALIDAQAPEATDTALFVAPIGVRWRDLDAFNHVNNANYLTYVEIARVAYYEHVTGNSHHDHLICTTCGAVIEFHDDVLEARQREICERKRFTPTFHNLQILGVCADCKKKGEQPDAPDRVKMIAAGALQLRK